MLDLEALKTDLEAAGYYVRDETASDGDRFLTALFAPYEVHDINGNPIECWEEIDIMPSGEFMLSSLGETVDRWPLLDIIRRHLVAAGLIPA